MANKHIWLLDAGHGGIIGGHYQTVGRRSQVWDDGSQFFEGEFNRGIVSRIAEGLTSLNIGYMLLAPELEDIPRHVRIQRAEDFYRRSPRPCILLSVHSNAGGGRGYEIFTSIGETESDEYAEVALTEFARIFPTHLMRRDLTDGDRDKEANFDIIYKTSMPALLTESFFYDNESECREILLTKEGRDKIAQAHINAIIKIEEG